jgi:hypothetical protein
MADIRYIDKTYIENESFQTPVEDLTIRIQLSDGEEVLFTAEKEFYTPRRIATNTSDVLELQNVVTYTPNNVAIIKMQNGQTDLTKPQYYINSIVRDVYKQYRLDNFFTELDDELAAPEFIGTLNEQRQLALNALLSLEDLAAAAAVGDLDAVNEAAAEIDENFSELAGFDSIRQLTPGQITTPEEEDQLAALDFVGLTNGPGSVPGGYVGSLPGNSQPSPSQVLPIEEGENNINPITGLPYSRGINGGTSAPTNTESPTTGTVVRTGPGPDDFYVVDSGDGSEIPEDSAFSDEGGLFSSPDTSDDIISPIPTVNEDSLITMGSGVSNLAAAVPGIDIVNNAIDILNTGIQQIEDSMQGGTNDQGQSNTVTVAPGKEAYISSGGEFTGIKPERKIPRSSIEKRLSDVETDISTQENTPYTILETISGVPTLVKIQKSTLFGKLINNLSSPGVLSALSKTVGAPKLLSNIKGTSVQMQIPDGYKPMQRDNLLTLLYKTKDQLETTLSQ